MILLWGSRRDTLLPFRVRLPLRRPSGALLNGASAVGTIGLWGIVIIVWHDSPALGQRTGGVFGDFGCLHSLDQLLKPIRRKVSLQRPA